MQRVRHHVLDLLNLVGDLRGLVRDLRDALCDGLDLLIDFNTSMKHMPTTGGYSTIQEMAIVPPLRTAPESRVAMKRDRTCGWPG